MAQSPTKLEIKGLKEALKLIKLMDYHAQSLDKYSREFNLLNFELGGVDSVEEMIKNDLNKKPKKTFNQRMVEKNNGG